MLRQNLLMLKEKPLDYRSEVLEISLSLYSDYPIFLIDQRNPTTFKIDPFKIYYDSLIVLKKAI